MTTNLFQTQDYKALMQEHMTKTIAYLFSKDQEFAIACEMKYVNFNPPLSDDILDTLKEIALFVLSGYTYESATLEEDIFSFEAGFGSQNIGSIVTVPLLAIKQIIIEEYPIMLNLAQPMSQKRFSDKHSMEILLSNPENQKLLKKKRP
ncbi:MAG: hypothetical protein LGB68_03755 [Sulfurovum sp.]|nr:hypothetical protein [Sulfurovum sp.]MCB4749343.1 hypothetical protein [Sulfurovum sp.]MCB4762364.1 hypothetical protein [Sulfurovum sp.]MCB4766317.1 hypothetical protein [Sulfurovum sp.]